MPALRIPKNDQLGLSKIKRLSDDDVDDLVEGLREAPISAGQDEIIASIQSRAERVPKEDLSSLVETLTALYVVRSQADVSIERFTEDLITAMQRSGNSALELPDDEKPQFQKRLAKLLAIDRLNMVSKAVELLGEHARTFYDARVLTDLRPVFKGDPAEDPVGFVVIHHLKLEYHSRGRHEEFYVALDSKDIEKLRDVLDRANAKEKNLKALLKAADMTEINVTLGD